MEKTELFFDLFQGKTFANAKQVDPVLEDLYLFYFREGE